MDEDLTKPENAQTPTEPQAPERSFRDEFLGQQPKDSSGTKVVIGILVVLILGGIVGAIIFLRNRSQEPQVVSPSPLAIPAPTPAPEPTPLPSPSPSSSPSPSPKLSTLLKGYKIQVLNGSGVPGAASKVVKLLEAEGATGVEAGNASSYNYETTEVSLKADSPTTLFSTIKNALVGYSVVKGKDLESTSKFDVVITVGAK